MKAEWRTCRKDRIRQFALMLSLRCFFYLSYALWLDLEVLKLKVLPYESLQQQAWVWISLFHLPPPSPFFLSLPSCFAVTSQRHTLYRPKKKKRRRKKPIHAADAHRSGSLQTHPKVLYGVFRGSNKMKSTDQNFFSAYTVL